MKVAMLAKESATTWVVVNAIKDTYPDLRLGIEGRVSRLTLLKRRAQKQGLLTVLGQMLFMIYLLALRKVAKASIVKILSDVGLSAKKPEDLVIKRFKSVNSFECQQWLRDEAPDVVIVNGTRIISKVTLEACGAIFLNIHCGITPAYRGVHGAYWALAKGDRANVGVTVHVVDTGIDTGEIVSQQTIETDTEDNFLTYPFKQYVAAIPLLKRALVAAGDGALKTHRRTDISSALWYHPTLSTYLKNWWKRGVR